MTFIRLKFRKIYTLIFLTSIVIIISIVFGYFEYIQNKNDLEISNNQQISIIRNVVPNLVLSIENSRDYSLSLIRFFSDLDYKSQTLDIILISSINDDLLSNLSEDTTKAKELGRQWLSNNSDKLPIPIERPTVNSSGSGPQEIAKLYISPKPYNFNFSTFSFSIVFFVFSIIVSFIIYILQTNQEYQTRLNRINAENRRINIEKQLKEEEIKTVSAENRRINIEKQLKEEEIKRVSAENKLLEIDYLAYSINHDITNNIIAPMRNQAQRIDNISVTINKILSLIKVDSDTISHDLRKTPLLHIERNKWKTTECVNANECPLNVVTSSIDELKITIEDSANIIKIIAEDIDDIGKLDNDTEIDVEKQLKLLDERTPAIVSKGIHIQYEYLSQPVKIHCNPWRFRSIVRNCLYNSSGAIKDYKYYLKNHDKSKFSEYVPKIKISYAITDTEVQVVIEDNGPGILENIIDDLYNSSKILNPKEGSGCGSQIVYAYLKFHNGQAKVTNLTYPTGARVVLSFPTIT